MQVPAITPAVISALWLARLPGWTLLLTELCDIHLVMLVLDCPIRTIPVDLEPPNAPYWTTEISAAVAKFAVYCVDTEGWS